MNIFMITQSTGEVKFLKTKASSFVIETLVKSYNSMKDRTISFQQFLDKNGIDNIYVQVDCFQLEGLPCL